MLFRSHGFGVRPTLYLVPGILLDTSKEVIGVENPDTPPPATPSWLSINNITQTSAIASWNAVTGATEYKVYLNGSLIAITTSLSHNLTGLSPETTYQVQVSAVGPGGEGEKASKNFKTLAPEPPYVQDTFEWFKFFMVAFATWLMPFIAAFIGIVVLALIWKIWRKYSNG